MTALANRDRLIVAAAAALAVGVPVILLWPAEQDVRGQAAVSVTPLPTISLTLAGAATTAPPFNRQRSPTPRADALAPQGNAVAPTAPPPALVGVALGKAGGVVLLKAASGETVQARVGDQVDGWRIVSIARDHATAEQDGRREDLTFDLGNKTTATSSSTPSSVHADIPLPPAGPIPK